MELLLRIEANHKVTSWKYKGVDCWPVIRQMIFNQLSAKKVTSKKVAVHKKSPVRLWKSYRKALKDLRKAGSVDYLFLANQVHRGYVNDVLWNRLCDPLMDVLHEKGKHSILIEQSKTDIYSQKNYKSDRLFQIDPVLNWLSYKQIWLKRLKLAKRPSMPFQEELDRVISDIKKQTGLSVKQAKATNEIERVVVYSGFAIRLLNSCLPNRVHIVCYYGSWAMSVIQAARKLNIPTSDIQHGVINDLHIMYSSWTGIKSRSYNVLPDTFFTWSAFDAEVIQRWAQDSGVHHAEPFGNPWLQAYKEDKLGLGEESSLLPDNSKPLILYTLANRDDIFFDSLVTFVKAHHDHFNIWFRLHPRQLPFREEVVDRLRKLEILDMVNIDEATNLPLPLILKMARLHVTFLSSVVIEALQFNLTSLVVGELGRQHYSMYSDIDLVHFTDFADFEHNTMELLNQNNSTEWEKRDLDSMAEKLL